jgi:hypothetical protein
MNNQDVVFDEMKGEGEDRANVALIRMKIVGTSGKTRV